MYHSCEISPGVTLAGNKYACNILSDSMNFANQAMMIVGCYIYYASI